MTDPEIPALNDPWMIVAFDGWNDAANASSDLIRHLIGEWDAEVFAEMDPEEFYDFQMHRPLIDPSEDRELLWPIPTVFVARPEEGGRDVLLMSADEPNFRWRTFCAEVLDLALMARVNELVVVGALLADTPHTMPVPITASSRNPRFEGRAATRDSHYAGPVGINAALVEAAQAIDLPTVSIWAAVPHYLAEPPCPKATRALLGAVEDLTGVVLPLGDLAERSDSWQRGADEVVSEDIDVAEYVRSLEEESNQTGLTEASGEDLAREFERYLRRRTDNPD